MAAGLMFTGCEKDNDFTAEPFDHYAQYKIDSLIIEDYVEENQLDAYYVRYGDDKTGVMIDITEEGTEKVDEYPNSRSVVTVKYKGYLTDGTVFDETKEDAVFTYPLSSLIGGWQLALPEMTRGDKATILVPSFYGYQNNAVAGIPANSVLIFDIELIDFR